MMTTCHRGADKRLTRTMKTWVKELLTEQLLGQQPEGLQRLSESPDWDPNDWIPENFRFQAVTLTPPQAPSLPLTPGLAPQTPTPVPSVWTTLAGLMTNEPMPPLLPTPPPRSPNNPTMEELMWRADIGRI